MPLYKFQKADVHYWAKELNYRGIFAWDCGLGKGYTGALIVQRAVEKQWHTLIITSRSLIPDWIENCAKLGIVVSEAKKITEETKAIITTYESAVKLSHQYDLIIADECHKVKSSTSKRGKHFQKLAKNAERLLMMTGTLSNKRDPEELLNYLWSLNTEDVQRLLPANITKYRARHSNRVDHPNINFPLYYSRTEGATIINNLIKKYVCRRKLDDELDLPPYIQTVMKLKSTFDADEIIKELSKELDLDVAMNTKNFHINHALMLGSGIDFTTGEVKNDVKLKAIEDIIEKSDQVVVWFTWKAYGEYLNKKIKDSQIVHGDISGTKRQQIVSDFRDRKFRVLLASQGTLAEGFNLQNACVQIFSNIYYDAIKFYQSYSRLYRNGQEKTTTSYVLVGKSSLEEAAWQVLNQKMSMAKANDYLQGVLRKRYLGGR